MAGHISEYQARNIATNFMAGGVSQPTSLRTAYKAPLQESTTSGDQTAYYVFNNEKNNHGFVIVAGDDRVPAVLGYSDTGTFDFNSIPPSMKEWLKGYTAQIEAIAAGGAPELRTTARAAIDPMLNIRWGQGMPYSVLLPHINGSSNAHAYVGCVAVAMAQVMAYWQYPARPTTTIPGYTSNSGKTYEVTMPSLSPMDFDWENMQDTYYTTDSTSIAAQAVSNLMLYSTTAMKSSFGLTSTGSYTRNIPETLITYFGYKNSAHYVYRENFSTEGWENLIYSELAAGRPVAYGGNKSSGGHAFVCDGYDGDGRFHINWGWAGKSNGYFLLNLLNPSEEGIGSSAGAYGYVYNQGAAIGIEPNEDGTDGTAAFTFEELSISSTSTTRSAVTSNFSVSVSGKFVNNTNVTSQFRQGWGLYSLDGELLDVLFMRYTTSALSNGEYISVNARALSFGAGMTSGTYRILPIYSIYPDTIYTPCIGSDVNYIEVTIGGTYSCTIKGYGTASSTTKYTVNSCTTEGTLNHGKPVTINLNLTNAGTSTNDIIYMFVDGEFNAMGLANILAGESGDLIYRFTPTTAGNKTVTFSLNESGSSPFYTKTLSISTMSSATLDVSYRIQGITDEENRVMTADKYSIIVDVTNTGTTTYDEDFSVRLYRINNPETNVGTELQNQTQPLQLAPGESTSLQFDFDHDLIDGWRYFCYLYYYSAGETVGTGTKWYTLNLTGTSDDRYTITSVATPTNGGTIRLTGGAVGNKATAGNTIAFTVTPNTGYSLNSVTVTATSGEAITAEYNSEDGTYTFTMPEDNVTINATFDEIPVYTITAVADNQAGGKYQVDATDASAGQTITVTANPNTGWKCDGVSVTMDGSTIDVTDSGNGTYTFVMPDGNVTVAINFSRSTGSLFELVDARANITADATYVLVSRNYDKVMKRWSDGDETFQADNITEWVGDDQAVVRVNDDAGFFKMTQVADTTISSNSNRTAAYLTNGNAYMRTSNYNVLMADGIVAESRAWMYIGNASNCLIRFKDSTSGSNGNWIVRYDNDADYFKVMNWTATGAEVSRVWLYKLVDSYNVNTTCSPVEGGQIGIKDGTIDGKAQAGETVSFVVDTFDEFEITRVDVITAAGDTISPSLDESGVAYSFTMPASDVTITAIFDMPPTPYHLIGDVNEDGVISIKDVTALIDYLLGGDVTPFNIINADVATDGSVTIKDVTALIDLLLNGNL